MSPPIRQRLGRRSRAATLGDNHPTRRKWGPTKLLQGRSRAVTARRGTTIIARYTVPNVDRVEEDLIQVSLPADVPETCSS